MSTLGIERGMQALCSVELVQPGLDGERDAILENVAVLKRLLQGYLPKVTEAYCRMNEFFERKPIPARKIDVMQSNMIAARFKIIELLQFLKEDAIIGKKVRQCLIIEIDD